jgi:hypothetical protein
MTWYFLMPSSLGREDQPWFNGSDDKPERSDPRGLWGDGPPGRRHTKVKGKPNSGLMGRIYPLCIHMFVRPERSDPRGSWAGGERKKAIRRQRKANHALTHNSTDLDVSANQGKKKHTSDALELKHTIHHY